MRRRLPPLASGSSPHVKTQMSEQAYGNWTTVVHESLVRASVVRYLAAHAGEDDAETEIGRQKERGFVWTDELADLLTEYEANRETFPTFESSVPEIVTFFEDYGEGIGERMAAEDASRPQIVALSPPNGATDVDPALSELRVTFDRPMAAGFSWCGGGYAFPKIPDGEQAFWLSDAKTCVLPVPARPRAQLQDWPQRALLQELLQR